jgi:hypothetical protein
VGHWVSAKSSTGISLQPFVSAVLPKGLIKGRAQHFHGFAVERPLQTELKGIDQKFG